MGRIYNALDRFLPFDRYLDPMFGGQPTASPIPGRPPMRGMAPQSSSEAMGSLAMPQAGAPRVAAGEKRVPKVSKLRVLDGVLGGLTFTDAIDAERARPAQMAAAQEEDAIAREVFKGDQRGYLAWRANREETGKALASGMEDYTLAPGAVRGRGTQQIMRAPTAPQTLAPGQRLIAEDGRLIADAPFKPEVTTLAPGQTATVVDPNFNDDIFKALIQQESGGRGDAVGPQTPYGRALGSTQMLPETAKGMADKLGLPWQPELMTGTSQQAMQYQETLGRAYLQEGLQRYGGDPEKALKYYHGGPDERLWGPKTEAYAAAVLGRVGPRAQTVAQGGPRSQWRQEGDLQYSPDGKVELVPQRQLPSAALKAEEEDVAALSTASSLNNMLGGYIKQIDEGALNFGPVQNLASQGALFAGIASPKDRNFASFRAGLERLRNESLRLNTGVQTDGDAQRAWNELIGNLNDEGFVRQRLAEIQGYNQRALQERKARLESRRAQYGLQPYGQEAQAPQRTAPPAGAATPPPPRRDAPAAKPAAATPPLKAVPAAASGAPVRVTSKEQFDRLPKGQRFIAPDGSVRIKP